MRDSKDLSNPIKTQVISVSKNMLKSSHLPLPFEPKKFFCHKPQEISLIPLGALWVNPEVYPRNHQIHKNSSSPNILLVSTQNKNAKTATI